MLRYPLLCSLLLFISFSLQAQVFEKGYLVLNPGDTLRGEVENLFWSDPPATVRFRAAPTAPLTAYSMQQLRSVGLASGRLLRREVVPLDHAAEVALPRLPTGLVQRQRPDTVLADVLVDGPATLLEVKLNDVKHFLIQREAQPYLELTERRYLQQTDNGNMRITDGNHYYSQLLRYFNDCPATVEAAGKAPYTAEGMVRVVQSYNAQCSAEKQAGRSYQVAEKARSGFAVQLGPMLGVRYNTTRLHQFAASGQQQGPLDELELDGRLHSQIGFYFDVVNPGRKLALHTALTYSRFGRIVAAPFTGFTSASSSDLRGQIGTLLVGLRRLGGKVYGYQWLVGAGAEVTKFKHKGSSFMGFNTTFLPYLEAGLRRDRLTLLLTGRLYGREEFSKFSFQEVSPGVFESSYTSYRSRTLSLALSLAFRLNRPDEPATQQR